MTAIKQRLLLFSFSAVMLVSCQKEEAEKETTICSCSEQSSTSEVKNWLTATTWQIEEVIDPFTGTRYKRGVTNDSKDFASARYTYNANNQLAGIDWFSNPIEHTCFTLLDNRQLKITSPVCTYIHTIITISLKEFSYKTSDGSIFILGPADKPLPTDNHK